MLWYVQVYSMGKQLSSVVTKLCCKLVVNLNSCHLAIVTDKRAFLMENEVSAGEIAFHVSRRNRLPYGCISLRELL